MICRLCRHLVCVALLATLHAGNVASGQDDERRTTGMRKRPARFYQWPLSQLAGAKGGSRYQDARARAAERAEARRSMPLVGTRRRHGGIDEETIKMHLGGAGAERGGASEEEGPDEDLPPLLPIQEDHEGAGAAAAALSSPALDFSGMRYWTKDLEKIPSGPLPPTDKFLSFEPWQGGFNNVRMSLELAMALAIATNRTLVLPEKNKIYNLGNFGGWGAFFDLEDMARGVPIMHQDEFFAKFGLPNPEGRTDFPKAPKHWRPKSYKAKGWQGIWEISKAYGFGEDKLGNRLQSGAIYCIPDCPKPGSEFYEAFEVYTKKTPVSISTSTWENSQIVHFSMNGLGHWYTSIFMRPKSLDINHKLAMKRHCHMNDLIFDEAEKVLREVLSATPSFSCLHIRRGDFQFKGASNEEIVNNTKKLLHEGEHLWIMTQEKKPEEAFAVMKERYELHFLKDYMPLLEDTSEAILPMIESVICSRARVFSGYYMSTMSGYIARLRGYMPDVADKNVYFNQMLYPDDYTKDWDNKYPTWIYTPGLDESKKRSPDWAREYREVWDTEWDITEGTL